MGDAIELARMASVDLRHAMPMHVAPEAGNAIEIPIAVAVDQVHPSASVITSGSSASHNFMCVNGCQRIRQFHRLKSRADLARLQFPASRGGLG
jgi:hypothetical protein